MIKYIEILDKIKDVKEEAFEDFNKNVSIPLILSNLNSTIKSNDSVFIIQRNNFSYELNIEVRKTFSEIICILKKIELELYNKIDYKYIDFFEKFKDVKYDLIIDKKFEDIELSYLTLEILTIFNLKFWYTDEERRAFLSSLRKIEKNESTEEIELDTIEEKLDFEDEKENVNLMKNNWWINLLNKIREFKKRIQK